MGIMPPGESSLSAKTARARIMWLVDVHVFATLLLFVSPVVFDFVATEVSADLMVGFLIGLRQSRLTRQAT